ncbi:MAG TPA: TetR-like C-terminal domain-containing protein [Euzebyales bacterium]
MPRVGLSTDAVVAAGTELVDRDGPGALSLSRVAAELGVRPPSLYNHVDGLDGLERLIAIDGVTRLAEACRTAIMGRTGTDALRAMAQAYRSFAQANPGVYVLTQVARPGDARYEAVAARLVEAVVALLATFGYRDYTLLHATRALRSALHGFVMLEAQSGFGLDLPVDDSFAWLVDVLERGITGPR